MDEELFNSIKDNALGWEFDWFAFDKKGQIGMFTTFYGCIVPSQVWESYENYGNTLNYFIGLQPELTPEQILDSIPGQTNDWKEYAKTGLFAHNYESTDYGATKDYYELKVKPEKPLLKADLKLEKQYIEAMPVLDVEFGVDTQINSKGIEKLLIT
ncbi:hypothetical protein K6119_07970 [Paracrocinitomix mangrovi]|uniref:hypothetical protein n=1 Tax=Paracrocinitomix mangrovi TaxID=2862509 RepID=UPI001C8EAD02|nr:hypothetical protein [Paracrocinitomix mangrovi]UKN03448.1 hypothetical protein K6119_07970 [Paracrocinitomix mangrovi]